MAANATHIIQKYQQAAPQHIVRAVEKAAEKTGVDFGFLMEKAAAESSFNPKAKAKTSSATGLFQFIENTWLSMVKKYGEKYGLEKYAEKISIDDCGRACVDDRAARNEILNLRKNPEIAALMAGEFSAENKEYLEAKTKGDVGATELYMAHFLGAGGAAKFLNAHEKYPDAIAAKLFPQAARANKNVFYDRATGQPRTLAEIYNRFDAKFNGGTSLAEKASPRFSRGSDPAPAAAAPSPSPSVIAARALPSYIAENIVWDIADDGAPASGFSRLSSNTLLALIETQQPEWRLNS